MTHNPDAKPAACGTWLSPLSAEAVTGSSVGLGSLSADGDMLYWLESRPKEQGRSALVRRKPDGSIEDVTPPPANIASRVHEYGGGAYAVSDGRIVYSEKSDGSVWLVAGNAAPRQIVAVNGCRYADFRFIPGTDDIVCVREDHRNRPPTDPEAAIVRLNNSPDAATNEGTVLVKGADFFAAPRPSPDGKNLAWISWQHPDMPWDATQLHTAELSAAGLRNIQTIAGDKQREAVVQPEWSPAGGLYFCTDRNNWWNLYKRENNGAVAAVTTEKDGEIGGAHWVFGGKYYDFTAAGGIVAVLSKGGKSTGVAIENGKTRDLGLQPLGQCPVPLGNELANIVTASDAPTSLQLGGQVMRTAGPALLDSKNISAPQEISFPTAGGDTAHAFYYPPANDSFKPENGEKPPLIVMIHGGPTSAASTVFSAAKQWWTTRGFAVVDVNYRGSTGYGRDYRQKLDGNWGLTDVEDCVAVVKHLVAEGKADPERVAIRGGSAGGFTVLAALTSSDVFKAGASHYGIGDLMLLAAETHKFEARYMDRLVGPLPETEAVYKERSPINHLDKMAAGAIFFQGLDDKVVPPSQAQTMVAAMRQKGLPVAHYEFEGEGHGFRKAETNRRVLELELGFYADLFGFTPPGLTEKGDISRPDKKQPAKQATRISPK
ncbi:MAG: S9 family peptidase [Micavibrio sp.]|nr:S9 family peptidase [Micavibrio sp.]